MSQFITPLESEKRFKAWQQAGRERAQMEQKQSYGYSPHKVISQKYGFSVETFLKNSTLVDNPQDIKKGIG